MLSIGASRAHADSVEESQSLGTSLADSSSDASSLADSNAFGFGSSYGESLSKSTVFQGDVFSSLFGNASNVAGDIAKNAGSLSTAANGLFDSGTGFLSELQGLSGADPQGAGENYLAGRVSGDDGLLNDQIGQIGKDLESFFGESILPQIRGDAAAAGALGGGRQGVAEGIAGRGLISEFGRSVLGLRTADASARDAAAGNLAGLTSARRLGATSTGLAALPGQLGLLESGSMAALSPFMALSQILGGPTVLTDSNAFNTAMDQSGSTSTSTSSSKSRSHEESLQKATSSAKSSSKSKSFNFGIGS